MIKCKQFHLDVQNLISMHSLLENLAYNFRLLSFTKRLFIVVVFCLKAENSCLVQLSSLAPPCLFYYQLS